MIKRSFILVGAVAMLAACGPREPQKADIAYVKAHDIKQLMQTVLEPQAGVFWKSTGTIINAQGQRDLTPTTEAGWLATRSAAATVTEMGNLLMTPLFATGRGEDWAQFSTSLVEIGKRAEKAAIDRDSDAIMETGSIMYNVCSACHQVYLPRPEAAPAAPQ